MTRRLNRPAPGAMRGSWRRRLLQRLLMAQWRRSLTRGERIRLNHFGATGNPDHHPFSWADSDDLR